MAKKQTLEEKIEEQVDKYDGTGAAGAPGSERPRYEVYAGALRAILERACEECGVMGFVEARAKSTASFVEKISRKGKGLDDPVTQFTDLCGARVIAQTQQEVDRICEFIRAHFKIDEANSPDIRSRLAVGEFGYLSDHLVVQMPWSTLTSISLPGEDSMSPEERLLAEVLEESLDTSVRPALRSWQQVADYIGNRKAEIQVRTLLQHAWAAITHDRVYKSEFDAPEALRRQLHRMAALMEEADGELQEAVDRVDTYNLNYAAYLEPDEIDAEISRWRAVLPQTDGAGRRNVAMKIARLARAKEDWDAVVEALQEHVQEGIPGMLRDLGVTASSGAGWSMPQQLRKAVAGEDWTRVRSLLSPHTAKAMADMLCEIGLAESIRKNQAGRGHLEDAVTIAPGHVDAHCYLGDTYCERMDSCLGGACEKAREHYARAFEEAPAEPRALRCYLECCLCGGRDISALRLLRPGLEAAIGTCRERASIGVYVPYAYYDMGIFELMLDRPYESLSAFAKAVHHSRTPRKVERALKDVEKLRDAAQGALGKLPEGAREDEREHLCRWLRWCEWLRRFLLLARAVKLRKAAQQLAESAAETEAAEARGTADTARDALCVDLATKRHVRMDEPVVVVAGGTDESVQDQMAEYGTLVMRAFAGFEGTIISGGTTAGICGVIGGLSVGGAVRKVSYLPDRDRLPADAPLDTRYDIREPVPLPEELRPGATEDEVPFTALEPIQGWIDLFCQEVAPEDVNVLGINGGTIAGFEYRLALALGATVGIIQSSGRVAVDMKEEQDEWRRGALVWLPADPMSLRAFVQPPAEPQKPFDEPDVLESAARTVHEKYREDKIASADPALKPWEPLDEGYKEANRQQVRYARRILATEGYQVRPKRARGKGIGEFKAREVERMAEMEHGRWVAERLRAGWQYGPKRDKEKKTSPYLCAWADLPENIKDYDRKAVRDWPDVMKEAGLKIVR